MVQQQIFVMFCVGKLGLDQSQFGHRFTSSLYVSLILSVLDEIGEGDFRLFVALSSCNVDVDFVLIYADGS